MNHYERKQISKQKQKRRTANKWFYGGGNNCSWDAILCNYPDARYWKEWHFSGIRKYAKDCTEGILRSKYRSSILAGLDENISFGSRRSHYRKHFDYWWTVY